MVKYYIGSLQEECRSWDVNEVIFSQAMWPVYQPLMRADFTLFDEYEYQHSGARPHGVMIRIKLRYDGHAM